MGTALIWALQAAAALPAVAATYHVDNTNPGCSPSGPGTQLSPYCTISAAVAQHPGPGNVIEVVAGTYREQVSIPASGVSGSPFVIRASGDVTVDGADDFTSPDQWTPVAGDVWLAAGVTWAPKQVFADSTRLTASTATPASTPARSFQYVAGAGLYVNAGGGNPAGHGTLVGRRLYGFTLSGRSWVTVRGFAVTRAEDKGILVHNGSSQCEISDNRVSWSFKYGIQVTSSNGVLVARNTSGDNGGHGIALTSGSRGCTVEDNESYRNADPQVRVANGLYLYGAPLTVIQRNRYHHNQDSGQHIQSVSDSCTSIQNRSWSNGDHGFDHLSSYWTLHVGDVATGNTMDGFSIEGGATGVQLYNCIATDNGLTTGEYDLWVAPTSVSGFVSDYNLFWNSTDQPLIKYIGTEYGEVADYVVDSGQDAQTIQADPRFMDPAAGDLRLQWGSPCIDAANSGVPDFPAADARGLPRMDDPATGDAGIGPVTFADRGALEYAPIVLTLTPSTGPAPLSVTANATGSLGPDGTAASFRFDFGDGSVAGPQAGATATHTYSAGEWTATVTVTDQSGGTGTTTADVIVTPPSVIALDRRIAASADDAEESSSATSVTSGIDLELVYDNSNQTVGTRWPALTIPPHAIINSAFVQFTSRDSRSEVTSLTIRGQAADNAPKFTTTNGNVSSRPRTTAAVSWAPPAWTTGAAGAAQRTPDLSAVIDEVVNRPGWASGNALALIVTGTGTGHRVAWSYDGNSGSAPLLHVEYTPDFAPVARLELSQLATPALTVTADASASTDPDPAPIASYRFTFGDGTPAVVTAAPAAIVQHTYTAPGNYTVTLTATDTRGLDSTPVTATFTVNGAPTAGLALSQLPSPPFTVRADATASIDPDPMPIASYRFDFGDSTPIVTTSAPTAIAQHAYAAAGTYTVLVTATDAGGLTSVATASITVDAPPVAQLTATQVASPPLTVRADASASTDVDTTGIATYRFEFGDGTPAVTTTAPAAIAEHTYTAAGVYTITLIATDSGGFVSAPATASVTVNGAPTARLSVAQLKSPPLTVSANASASTDPDPMPIASYRFDFGDSTPAVTTTAPAAAPRHAYAAAGIYTVSLTVTDAGGLASTATARITVDAAPVARLTATQAASRALTVNVSGATSTDGDATPISSYRFNFGDGTQVTTNAPAATAQHTYAAPGDYTVMLTAADTKGYVSAPAFVIVTVNAAPTAALDVTAAASPPLTVNADASGSTDHDPKPIASYRFDFGDGTPTVSTTAPTAMAQHAYAAAGNYTVRVTATDTGGLTSAPAAVTLLVDSAPIARLAVAEAASPPQTANADASTSTDTDGMPIASYRFDFGDGTPAVTTTAPTATAQHTYATGGNYAVTLIATDISGKASAPATAVVVITTQSSLDKRVATGTDDAEEPTGAKPVTSGIDIRLVTDASVQTVGMRWTGIGIPRGATITRAWIQFDATESQAEATSLTIRGQAADNPSTFNTGNANISSRPRTTAAVTWAPPTWNAGEAGESQRTSELKTVIQEIVNRTGWASGNALAIIVTGSGVRTAWSYNGSTSQAPLLHVEYWSAPAANVSPVARLTVTQAASPALTVTANGSSSTDSDVWPVASYRFDFGDGTPEVTTTAPTPAAPHTYAAPGTYTVSLTTTDTGGLTSAPVTASITVAANAAPVARLSAAQAASPALTVNASGSASTDTDPWRIATYRFTWGDGTPAVTTTSPTAAAKHTYAVAGTYTVSLTATDAGGLTSAPATASVTVTAPATNNPPIARLTLTQAPSPPLTVSANGSTSTDGGATLIGGYPSSTSGDAVPIASYRFDFGDSTPAVTTAAPNAIAQHTYAAAGTYTVTLVATDTDGLASAPATASISVAVLATVEQRVTAWIDDVEEAASGTIFVNSSDLELGEDGSTAQTVGMRWAGLAIPKGATITSAWIQFTSKEAESDAASLTLRAEASDHAEAFTSSAFNLTARTRTTATVSWSPAAWVAGEAGADQRTPGLEALVQEVVNRPGWASGNAIAVFVNGAGTRTAWAYDGNAAAAPLLHVEYTAAASAAVARAAVASEEPSEVTSEAAAALMPAALPSHLALSAARPNPAAGPVSFRIDLPAPTHVTWGIYDVQGRRLWSEERMFDAGSAVLSWDGRVKNGTNAGAGLYFARVHADNRVLMRRFIRL